MFTLQDLLDATGGTLVSGQCDEKTAFRNASIDSRSVQSDQWFFAINAARDGHDFIGDAVLSECGGLVVSREVAGTDNVPVVRVEDTLVALQQLGAHVRQKVATKVIAITGSVGKTTTKEALGHILAKFGKTVKSAASFNNHLGVPLTLTDLAEDTAFAVIEVGTNHPGEIRPLARLASPQVGIITKIGWAHIGNFGSREAIAKEKLEILPQGLHGRTVILNGDDPLLMAQVAELRERGAEVITVGTDSGCNYRCGGVWYLNDKMILNLEHGEPRNVQDIEIIGYGAHLVHDVSFAVAAAVECGIAITEIADAMKDWCPPSGRSANIFLDDKRVRIIDDSYNASPDAMLAGLEMLREDDRGRKIAVLGEMRELGEWTEQLHTEVGRRVANIGAELIAIGEAGAIVQEVAVTNELPEDKAQLVKSAFEALPIVQQAIAQNGDVCVLVKGSRFMHMERVVLGLQGEPVGCRLEVCQLYINCKSCSKLASG